MPNSEEYWKQREQQKQARVDIVMEEQVRRIRSAIEDSIVALENQVYRIYAKYAVDNKMSYADTQKYLNDDTRKEFQRDLKFYLEKYHDKDYVKKYKKELHSLSVRARVKELDALIANIQMHSSDLEELLNTDARGAIAELYGDAYLRQLYELVAGHAPTIKQIVPAYNTTAVREIMETPWSGKNYSKKVWDLSGDFADKLEEVLTRGIIQGQHPREMARAFRKYGYGKTGAGGLVYRAEALLQTEASNVVEQAQKNAYNKNGIEEYVFMTSRDRRVCGDCADLEGKCFKCKDAAQGSNYPPIHTSCRCTTRAKTAFDGRDADYYNLHEADYDAWKEKYVKPEIAKIKAEQAKASLAEEEQRALNSYIGSNSYKINAKLRDGAPLDDFDKEFVANLDKALDKMPSYVGQVSRSVYFYDKASMEKFLEEYSPGNAILNKAYTSTTAGMCYNKDAQVQLYINSRNGKDIRAINQSEQEVLYKRDTKFEVLDKVLYKGAYHIMLEEK